MGLSRRKIVIYLKLLELHSSVYLFPKLTRGKLCPEWYLSCTINVIILPFLSYHVKSPNSYLWMCCLYSLSRSISWKVRPTCQVYLFSQCWMFKIPLPKKSLQRKPWQSKRGRLVLSKQVSKAKEIHYGLIARSNVPSKGKYSYFRKCYWGFN